ncbi:MAG: stalk domain-containing protein [Caldisericum sp.]|uniref:stalk domain-containing protein n=2 Tax=Caldisericum sp. TaxID=2499687 RepID=UPI003D0F51DC
MRKILAFLIVLSVVFSPFVVIGGIKAISVAPPFNVEVDPINGGVIAQYRIYGSYSDYDRVGILKLYFRDDTRFKFDSAPYESILVNGDPVKGAQFKLITSDNSVELTLYLSKLINKGDNVEILIKKEAGLVNPITPATCYKVRLVYLTSSGAELGATLSNSYRITVSSVQDVVVNVDPAVRGIAASYVVRFLTGAKGALRANEGEIRIKFPEGTTFPQILTRTNVKINGYEASGVYRSTDDPFVLRIYAPIDIPAYYPVMIEFSEKFGIRNLLSGVKTISLSTSVEETWINSESFTIYDPQVQNLSVKLSKDFTGAKSGFEINFTTSPVGYLPKGKYIYIDIGKDFSLNNTNLKSLVTVNSISADASINGNVIVIASPLDLSALQNVSVSIKEEAGIINPIITGTYSIYCWTDTDSYKVSAPVVISESTVSEVVLKAKNSGISSLNEFDISFKTGPVKTLQKGKDTININFDSGFVFSVENMPKDAFRINGIEVENFAVKDNTIYLYAPQDIYPNTQVEVNIFSSAGIKNPMNQGEYGVTVSTSQEAKGVPSNKLKIVPLPIVEFNFNPSLPDGMNGIYRTLPEVTLSTSNGVKVFYKIDEGEFKEFEKPFKIYEGIHSIFAYAVDISGNQGEIIEKKIFVDNTSPTVNIDSVNSGKVIFGASKVISGLVSEPCILKVNNQVLELKDDLRFSVPVDVKDGDPVIVWARDLAGNQTTIPLTAKIDLTPPEISFVDLNAQTNSSVIQIETTEEKFTLKINLNENGRVFVNGIEVPHNSTTYVYMADLNYGDNVFEVDAYDLAGNKSTKTVLVKKVDEKVIKLQIGSKEAITLNGGVPLEQSPFIENGTTLVPLRFIAETFGSTVNYNDALKLITVELADKIIQVQIDSSIALINNSVYKLTVPPKIVKGITFVPLRFIAEAFGAKVDWNQATKTITITYKP